jgi:hypothetical protein
MTLPPLATVDDLTMRLGRPLTVAESSRVDALLSDSSALIRRYCRRDFLFHAGDVKSLKASDSTIKLPGRPIVAVNSVTAVSGNPTIPDIPITWYTFDKIDEVTIIEAAASGIINLPEAWYMGGVFPGTFDVNYDHGYSEYPSEVVAVCANSVISVLLAPNRASGIIGESVGGYSYRVTRAGGGIQVALNESDIEALADFRDRYGTIPAGGWR